MRPLIEVAKPVCPKCGSKRVVLDPPRGRSRRRLGACLACWQEVFVRLPKETKPPSPNAPALVGQRHTELVFAEVVRWARLKDGRVRGMVNWIASRTLLNRHTVTRHIDRLTLAGRVAISGSPARVFYAGAQTKEGA